MTSLVDWLRDVGDGVSSLRHGLTWNGEVRRKGRGVLPRRCGVCGAWTRGATRFSYFVDVNTTAAERTRVYGRVCGACWRRHRRLEPEAARWRESEDRRRLEEYAEEYRRWLRRAPAHPPPAPEGEPDPPSWYPEPFGMEPRPGQEPAAVRLEDLLVERVRWGGGDHERWILDLDTAARELARRHDGAPGSVIGGPDVATLRAKPRHRHAEALRMTYATGGSRDVHTGSVFRLEGSRVLVVWRLARSYMDD